MGLAASQARYLALTARKSDLEYRSQTINSRRIQLSYKTSEIANKYTEKMNNSKIMLKSSKIVDGNVEPIETALDFENLIKDGNFAIIGTNGKPLNPQPYKISKVSEETVYKPTEVREEITAEAYGELSNALKCFYEEISAASATDGSSSTGTAKRYKLKTSISQADWNTLLGKRTEEEEAGTNNAFNEIHDLYQAVTEAETQLEFDEDAYYNNQGGYSAVDIQTLLMSGRAQIVSKDFFDFLCLNGYDYASGLTTSQFNDAMDKWNKQTANAPSIIDWSSDQTNQFEDRNYTEDDEAAYREYEVATRKINEQDKRLEMEEKNIETQHKAIETEMESVKKVIQKNMEETFKIFS